MGARQSADIGMKPNRPPNVGPPARSLVAFCLSALLAGWGLFEYASFEPAYQARNADPYFVNSQAIRFVELAAQVPPEAALGFWTDLDAGSTGAIALYNVAQWHLAPRLLTHGFDQDLILGNFARPADFAALATAKGLKIEKDFGRGIILFRRQSPAREKP